MTNRKRAKSIFHNSHSTRRRRLFLERLEARACPAGFTSDIVSPSLLVFDGTNSKDELTRLWIDGGTIWYRTNRAHLVASWNIWSYYYDTGFAAPTSFAPVTIVINGFDGDDTVDISSGLATFEANSISLLQFHGLDGMDTFISSPAIEPAIASGASPRGG
jgi:hypothetical protein